MPVSKIPSNHPFTNMNNMLSINNIPRKFSNDFFDKKYKNNIFSSPQTVKTNDMFYYNNMGQTGKYLFKGQNVSLLNNGFISPRGYHCNMKKNNLKIQKTDLNNVYNDIYKTYYDGNCNYTIFKKAATPFINVSKEVLIIYKEHYS